jgi:hypothetical protein
MITHGRWWKTRRITFDHNNTFERMEMSRGRFGT